jgi:hypothetical protein
MRDAILTGAENKEAVGVSREELEAMLPEIEGRDETLTQRAEEFATQNDLAWSWNGDRSGATFQTHPEGPIPRPLTSTLWKLVAQRVTRLTHGGEANLTMFFNQAIPELVSLKRAGEIVEFDTDNGTFERTCFETPTGFRDKRALQNVSFGTMIKERG